MEQTFFKFDTHSYLNTLAVGADLFRKALETEDPALSIYRELYNFLKFGNYPAGLTFPIEFYIYDGNKKREVMEIRWGSSFLISTGVRDIFQQEGLTGWQPYDVIVKDKHGETVPGYCGFSVTGRWHTVFPVEGETPDFYHTEYVVPGALLCTQRVIDVLRKYKLRDFTVTPYILVDNDGFGNPFTSLGKVKI